jgi:hypothetical protein
MKNSKLQKLAWVFFALSLATITAFGQGRGNGNRYYQNQNGNCLQSIQGLTEKQQKQIQKMEDEHQDGMAKLREKRRSTAGAIEKSEIRTEMLKKVEAHRKEVRGMLTEDQQKQYDQLHAYGNYGRNQNVGRGQANFVVRGNGNRNFVRRGNRGGNFIHGNQGGCYSNTNFRGTRGSFQQGYGRGAGNRAGFVRGNNRNFRPNSCVNSRNIDTCGFKVIPGKEFE